MSLGEERGATLIGVLWVTLLLSLLAVGVSNVSLVNRRLPATAMQAEQNRHLAESAITLFLNRYLVNESGEYVFAQSFEVMGINTTVSMALEDSKIGLNKADYHTLSAAIAANGYENVLAESIADAVIDWRDRDDLVVRQGAEAAEYAASGHSYSPRNGPFETVGEFRSILGVTDEMFECLMPVFTVYSSPDIEGVELDYAPVKVRQLFEWAFNNDWHGQNWPVVSNGEAGGEDLDLSSRSITLSVSAPEIYDGEFSKIVRVKSSSDQEVAFVEVRGLRREAAHDRCP